MSFNTVELINPKTPEQCTETIKQTFWIFCIMAFSKISSAAILIWLIVQTGINDIGSIPNTDATSFSEISMMLFLDFFLILGALFFYRQKKSIVAAAVLALLAFGQLYNVIDAYFIQSIATIKPIKLLLAVLYAATGALAILATYRLKKAA